MMPRGCLRDEPGDERGVRIGRLVGGITRELPAAVYLFPDFVERIPFQNGESCVGNAIAQALRVRSAIEGDEIDPSAMAIYALARQVAEPTRWTLRDEGSYPARAIEGLESWGVVDRERWPDDTDPRERVTVDVLEAGKVALVRGVYRIDEAGEERGLRIRQALYDRRPVFWCRMIDVAYERLGDTLYRGLSGSPVGGHAGCLVGYDAAGVWDAGSWSRTHGRDGFAHIAWSFVQSDDAFSFYVFTTSPAGVV